MIAEIDRQGIIATPANSYINELVVEAARLSILRDGAADADSRTSRARMCNYCKPEQFRIRTQFTWLITT